MNHARRNPTFIPRCMTTSATLSALAALTFALATPAHAQNRAPAGPAPVSGVGADGKLAPVVRDGMMYPVLEFADSAQVIHQSLWVETNFDSDRDGKPDRVH